MGVKNVNIEKIEKNVPTQAIVSSEVTDPQRDSPRYTSSSYQRVLDYHVSEILLTTIIIGVVLLLRLHH
jgi:hypothetical protein